ncbi:MAG: acetyl-CoA carboxylase biotin carboxylase subunit [Desulfobacteraceae bacterium]|nr:MAG: acetyl-CoA carboxylase biotin carboxylase subunit [Desulfobacteraceae bacterium]
MFKKILVANRGEIALRVIRTCQEMGIASAAVYSDADRKALHVLRADQAIYIGASEPASSYLDIEKIIAAAKGTGAQAIHPGYGFLSENAGLARRCEEEGLVFIGPPFRVIQDLGDKTVARKIMSRGGIPIIPGMAHAESVIQILAEEAGRIGYPVLIKAAAGGGGKGMRIVFTEDEIADACRQAASEAQAAFGNGAIYLEKFLKRPRHIEFQILADSHGNIVHLLERECSIQRRHQKVIEETPSPVMTPDLRAAMGQSAVDAARASGYVNAGTVEFLLDENGKYYFLEVNTRLQVEHPITEMITGIDIVRQQIRIAAGEPLGFTQADVKGRGHAIECRIYGEDPENDFMPSPGKIAYLQEPSGPGIRNDCGIYSGFVVPVEYDPILSKLIVWAADRNQAVARMKNALSQYVILGIKTPIAFLMDVLASEPFRDGETCTDFIATHFEGWKQRTDEVHLAVLAYVADEIAGARKTQARISGTTEPFTPWQTIGNWRL